MEEEKEYFFYNCMLERLQFCDGEDGYLAETEVLRDIFYSDFRKNCLVLDNPETDYYHVYAKPPENGKFLIRVAKPACESTIDVVIDTRLFPNFVMIEKINGMLEECLDVKRAVEKSLNKAAGKYGLSLKLKKNQLNVVHHIDHFITIMEYAGNTGWIKKLLRFTINILSPGNQIIQNQNNINNASYGQ